MFSARLSRQAVTGSRRAGAILSSTGMRSILVASSSKAFSASTPASQIAVLTGPPIQGSFYDRKGKQRAIIQGTSDAIMSVPRISRRDARSLSRDIDKLLKALGRRSFHASARRDAIPLLPAGIAILKSTSLLTIVTAISRVLISFFPIGTMAAFRFSRITSWITNEVQKPKVSEEAEEFYKMWCEKEKGVKTTPAEAEQIVESEMQPDKTIVISGGRISHTIPFPPGGFGRHGNKMMENPKKLLQEDPSQRKRLLSFITRTRFFLPPLPDVAEPYFARLSLEDQSGVQALRTYWISLKMYKDRLAMSRVLFFIVFILPCLLLCGVYVAALERVPLTGRWRIILLTPDEEDKISSSLAGANWYKAVINLLTSPEAPAPPVVPYTDWRWSWVEGVLRRLETAAVADGNGYPIPHPSLIVRPPPADYPLKPRPRASSMLHSALPGSERTSGKEHLEIGPPYSLMLMQKDDKNAFSYGFGGRGAGGIVVFTGLLDDILRNDGEEPAPSPPPPRGLFGGLFSSSPPAKVQPQPTEEQTLHLACVLSHEMGHLLLSHHLETLSQQQVLWPSILGFSMDLIRAFIWPFTLFLGPTVNDALANVGRTSTDELADRYGEIGFQFKHEYEADLAGLRILALAGYDPRAALDHFAASVADLHEIKPMDKDKGESLTGRLFKLWTTATHPSSEQRVGAIRTELDRWENAQKAVRT